MAIKLDEARIRLLKVSGGLEPAANNSLNLGTSSYKWANVYATTFNGALNGNATSATKATQDGDGNVIKNTYLKLAGGTMTGNLQIGNSSSSATTADAIGISVRDLRAVSMAPSTLGDRTAVFYFDEAGPSGDSGWKGILRVKGWTGSYAAWELAGPANSSDTKEFYVRSGLGEGSWGAWRKLLTSDNYTSYTVTKTGTGASGNSWAIGITGNAATATKLATARAINGTNFDGSAAITTANWGTARTISISSTAGTTGTSINGSGNASLVIPSTMTGFKSIATDVVKAITLATPNGTPVFRLAESVNVSSLGTSASDEEYLKLFIKNLCAANPNSYGVFRTTCSPNSVAYIEVYVYGTSTIDSSTGLPQYCFGTWHQYSSKTIRFWTADYTFGMSYVLTSGNYSSYALPKSGGTLSGALTVNSTITATGNIKGAYIQGTWLQTSAATALTTATKIAVIHSDNYIYYISPANLTTLIKNNASGTWAINISGSSGSCTGNAATASSVAWSGITGKPSSYTPSSHTHSYITSSGTMTMISGTAKWANGFTVGNIYSSGYPFSYGTTWMYQGTFGAELIFDGVGGDAGVGTGHMYFRTRSDWATSTWGDWKHLLDSSNYSSYALPLSGGTMTGSLTINNSNSSGRISLFEDGEGGTLTLTSKSGTYTYHMDAYNDEELRIHTADNNPNGTYQAIRWNGKSGGLYATTVHGAVWNDYAEYRESDCIEPGRVLIEKGDDTLTMSTEHMQSFAGISSDTFGFAIGETETAKTPIAVAGRVLVYTNQDRNTFKPGDVVCAGPNGTVEKMSRNEIIQFPDRIVGTVSCVPEYEIWVCGNGEKVQVNGRIWIKVR